MTFPAKDATERAQRQWYALRPAGQVAKQLFVAGGFGAVWMMGAMALGLRVFSAAHRSTGGIIVFASLMLAGLALLAVAFRAWLIYRNFDDARVLVDRPDLMVGEEFHVKVEQRARRGLQIEEMRLGLVCNETVRQPGANGKGAVRTLPLLERWETCTRNKRIDHARELAATRKFRVPPGQPGSTPVDQKAPPIIRWKLRVITAPSKGRPYEMDFPIRVRAGFYPADWDEITSESPPPN